MVPVLKKGDTFAFTAAFEENSEPVTGIAAKLKAQVRDPYDKLITEIAIAETETLGTYLFTTEDTTEDWPVGQIYCDIQLTDGEIVTSSETFSINLVKDVTR